MQLGVGISLVSDSLGLRINARTKIKIIIDVQLTLYKQKTRALPTELEKAKVLVLVGVLPCRRVYHTSAERENLMQWYFCTSHVGPNMDQNQLPLFCTLGDTIFWLTNRQTERKRGHKNTKTLRKRQGSGRPPAPNRTLMMREQRAVRLRQAQRLAIVKLAHRSPAERSADRRAAGSRRHVVVQFAVAHPRGVAVAPTGRIVRIEAAPRDRRHARLSPVARPAPQRRRGRQRRRR